MRRSCRCCGGRSPCTGCRLRHRSRSHCPAELEVVADLAATHEPIAVAVSVGEAEGVEAGHRHNRGQSTQSRWHGEPAAAEGEVVEEVVVVVAVREAVTRVHTDIEAGPGEHRNRHDRSRRDILAAGRSAARAAVESPNRATEERRSFFMCKVHQWSGPRSNLYSNAELWLLPARHTRNPSFYKPVPWAVRRRSAVSLG